MNTYTILKSLKPHCECSRPYFMHMRRERFLVSRNLIRISYIQLSWSREAGRWRCMVGVYGSLAYLLLSDIVKCKINKQNILIFKLRFVFYPQNVLSKMKSHIKVKITVVCLQNLHFQAKLQTICKNNTYFSVDFTRAHFLKYGVDGC